VPVPYQTFNPPGLPTAARMSWAVRSEQDVLLSGHVAYSSDGTIVGEGDPEAQAEQIFVNIKNSLAGLGATFEHVLKVTCYCVNVEAYAGYAAAKPRYLPEPGPAGTAVVVAALLDPRLLLEVEVVARVPSRATS
jgi:enamine deaminase RidA (YjgF/YER057c/UK114 family)